MACTSARSRVANPTSRPRRGQLGLALAPRFEWGGKREGAGRRRGSRVSHGVRPTLGRGRPVHVTLRLRGDLPSLRRKALRPVIEAALRGVLGREGFRVVHYSVQSNHAHLLVEASSAGELSRGMQALSIRLSKGVNRALGRGGSVLSDRYHARVLRTPREVRNAICYVLQNHRRHVAANAALHGGIVDPTWIDPCSSGRAFDGWRSGDLPSPAGMTPSLPVSPARFWLLTVGWRRHGLLAIDEVPPAAWA